MKSLLLSFMQDLREKDGIPDIRWAARFCYLVNFMEEGLLFNSTSRVLLCQMKRVGTCR
jgi:hypothetical protein